MRELVCYVLMLLTMIAMGPRPLIIQVATADGCAPCALMKANAKAYAALGSPLNFVKDMPGIDTVPTLIWYRDGKEVGRLVGFHTPQQVARKSRELRQ